jgi:cytochrome c oxidase assembly protein subunit 11
MRLSQDPTIDTVAKLGAVSVAMFAFVFVVMVPLYNVLCDALGINGKTSSEAYISVSAEVDESRSIKVQFIATNNDGMPWAFSPEVTEMLVHPGAANDTVFFCGQPNHECHGGAGDTQCFAVQSRRIFSQDRVFLFRATTARR